MSQLRPDFIVCGNEEMKTGNSVDASVSDSVWDSVRDSVSASVRDSKII